MSKKPKFVIPPEWCTGHYFYAPVRAWKQLQHVPQDFDSRAAERSRTASQNRDKLIASDDPWVQAVAKGDIGGMAAKSVLRVRREGRR